MPDLTKPPFYITTPIYYVNDAPHIGHAYTTIACDVMARFMHLNGHEVFFLTGTDEHGQKVAQSAEKAGVTPQEICDQNSEHFKRLVKGGENILNATNNDFIRTTEERHKKAAQELWRRIEANGYIYKANYGGWYAVRDEAYYGENELIEKDGKKCAPTGAEVEWVEEESYFFKLSAFEEPLLELYEKGDFVHPKARLNEVRSFVKGGLRDLSISRTSFDWGIPVPGGNGEVSRPSEPSAHEVASHVSDSSRDSGDKSKTHVMYVWIDALTNYLTALGWPEDTENYQEFWADNAPTHVVGKDILRFHAVYWPAFLMAADLPLPKRVVAHGWWTKDGEKMSKSLGNFITPDEMIEQAGGIDPLRYFLLKAMPFGNDGDFSQERMIELINADLANNIGNLAQRTLSMIQKNCEGRVPRFQTYDCFRLNPEIDIHEAVTRNQQYIDYQFYAGLITKMASNANEYIDEKAPWTLRKEGKQEELEQVLYTLAESIRHIAILLQPFCPTAAEKLLDQLAVPKEKRYFAHLTAGYALEPGTTLPKPEGVFPRLQVAEKAA